MHKMASVCIAGLKVARLTVSASVQSSRRSMMISTALFIAMQLTSVLLELNLCQPLVQVHNRIWTYLDSDARKRRYS